MSITIYHNVAGMDFDLSSATIPFTIGGLSQKCIDFIAHEDNAVESGELVRIGLGGIAVGSPDAALITISDTSRKSTKDCSSYILLN